MNFKKLTIFLAFQKTICTCLLDGLHDSELLTCPSSHQLDITDAILYDYGDSASEDNCSLSKIPDKFKNIKNEIRSICSIGPFCRIKQSDLINMNENEKIDCLTILVIWNCLRIISNLML